LVDLSGLWYPHSATPTTDAWLWLRWLLGVTVVWWLPGWLLLRGRLNGWPRPCALYAQLAAGFVAVVVIGLAARVTGRGWPVAVYVVATPLLLAAAARLWPRRGQAQDAGDRGWWGIAASSLVLLVVMVVGFRNFCAPPHVHDASNHAFLVARAKETGSLAPALIFAHVQASKPYLAGWHFVAAVTASVGGIAPYVAAWFTAITAVALTPFALATLWWRWGAGPAVAAAAVAWVATNADVPAGLPFSWGGFGQQVAFFLVPLGVVVAAAALRTVRWRSALATGLYVAVMIHVHAAEGVVVGLLAVLTLLVGRGGASDGGQAEAYAAAAASGTGLGAPRGDTAGRARSRAAMRWLAAGAFMIGLAFAYDPAILEMATSYAANIRMLGENATTVAPERAARVYLLQIGPPDVRFLWLIGGLAYLLVRRRWRAIAIASLVLGVWLVALQVWNDPVSRALATPFYSQAARVAYLQIYLQPFAAGVATVVLLRAAARRRRILVGLAAGVTVYALAAGLADQVPSIASLRGSVPFDRDEYALARRIPTVVGPDEVVANYRDDGSTWAWHVSGVSFLCPMSWECYAPDGTRLMDAVRGFRERPWPAITRRLEERGVCWLYVSDDRLDEPDLLAPEDFADDSRFTPVLQRGGTRLLRVEWERTAE
jgi:hypothetical protein